MFDAMSISVLSTTCISAVAFLGGAEAISQFDEETKQQLLHDPLTQVETFYTSYTGTTTARVTGFISSISSCLIILIVLRSHAKLSTSYHRIMVGMSVADTSASLAIFCSTWLMPKDMIYKQFQGAAFGNSATCAAQGFLFFTGICSTFLFNASLCVYYLCVIRLKYDEARFRKCLEPFLFSISISMPLIVSGSMVYLDLIAPSPWDFTCTDAPYPYWCNEGGNKHENETAICSSPVLWIENTVRFVLLAFYGLGSVVIFSTMILICWTVYAQERSLRQYLKMHSTHIRSNNSKARMSEQSRYETKVIMIQAIGYLGAFILCQIFPLLCLLEQEQNMTLQILHVALRPLQGFFNFMIFMGHKVHNLRRSNNKLAVQQAFFQVLLSKYQEPTLFLGNMNIVDNECEQKEGGENGSIADNNFSHINDTSMVSRENDPSLLSQGTVSYAPTSGDRSNVMSTNASGLSYDDTKKEEKSYPSRKNVTFSENFHDDTTKSKKSSSWSKQSKSSMGISLYSISSRPSDASRDLSYAVSSIND